MERKLRISHKDSNADLNDILDRLPQGGVLGTVLHSLYTNDVSKKLIAQHNSNIYRWYHAAAVN